jgi:pimeloyl-ACP methyl ester carboxylesterase
MAARPQTLHGIADSPVGLAAWLLDAPRSWTERAYPNLIYYHQVDRGGHFAAWEQPQPFTGELRAGTTRESLRIP